MDKDKDITKLCLSTRSLAMCWITLITHSQLFHSHFSRSPNLFFLKERFPSCPGWPGTHCSTNDFVLILLPPPLKCQANRLVIPHLASRSQNLHVVCYEHRKYFGTEILRAPSFKAFFLSGRKNVKEAEHLCLPNCLLRPFFNIFHPHYVPPTKSCHDSAIND